VQLPPGGNFQQNRRPFLIVHSPRYPGTRASPAKAPCPAGQQAGHRTGPGIEGDLLVLLALQIRDLGGGLFRLLVLAGYTQPPRTNEKGGLHAARP
jgi:hypothetical protein